MSSTLLVSTRKGLFTVKPSGGAWSIDRTDFLGDTLSISLADPRDGAIYAGLEHGHFGPKLKKSIDGGATWQEITVPAFPAAPATTAEPAAAPAEKPEPAPRVVKLWSLEPGHASEPGVLWCGTIPGGLFRSEDGGQTWNLVESLWNHPDRKKWFGGGAEQPGIHSICVHPTNPRHVTLGVSCGGVWVTTDGGETWNCRAQGMRAEYMPPDQQYNPVTQDPHRVVQCRTEPNALWAQHHNGIFRSTDGSETWTELTEVPVSAFGFAVVVHPEHPDTAWFIPGIKDEKRIPVNGKLVVTRTRDGGKTFDVLDQGLPDEHAYDIVYRHALDISGDGTTLAFGSTTGSLWISTNGGDSWETISRNLPPIYAVQFAA